MKEITTKFGSVRKKQNRKKLPVKSNYNFVIFDEVISIKTGVVNSKYLKEY